MKKLIAVLVCLFAVSSQAAWVFMRAPSTDATISLVASGNGTLTPVITFTGTCNVYVDSVYHSSLTSTVAGSIAVTTGQTINYVFSDVTGVTSINFASDPIVGDIDQLTQFTNCTYLNLQSCTLVTGDLSDLTGMPLTYLSLFGCTLVTGDLSDLTGMPLTNLYLTYCTLVTWTANGLDGFTVMTTCNLYNLGWDQTDVDAALASLVVNDAAGAVGRNCTVDIAGTNSHPTDGGLTDRDTLVASGWTVAVTATP